MTHLEPDLSFRNVIRGIGFAWAGVRHLVRTQRSARIHLACTLLVFGLALLLRRPSDDWTKLLLAVSLVWVAEAANTAVELLADVVCPSYHEGIKNTKDVAAAAVFFAAIGAVAVCLLVLLPPLWDWIRTRL